MTVVTRFARVVCGASMAVALALPSVVVVGSFGTAHADPGAVARAQADLERIEAKSAEADARYTELQSQLDQATQNLEHATQSLGDQERKVDELSTHLGQMALSQYQNQGVDVTAQLLGSDSDDDFLSTLATMDSVQGRTNDRMQDLQVAQAELAGSQRAADEARDSIAKSKAEQAKVAERYDELQAEAEAVLKRLTAEEKARLEAERKKKEEAEAQRLAEEQRASRDAARADREAERQRTDQSSDEPSASSSPSASRSSQGESSSSDDDEPATSSGSASGRASQALSYALAQIGDSYVMGATGPSAFDCSGLMLASYRSAGVGLPRTSQAQFGAGRPVSTSNLQPGDLVFYYSGVSHVAMYIGNGRIVHAANPRTGVKVSPLTSMPIVGARRVA